uniref:Biogenesis of lysosome-related organelles complex 1 subunit 1 n=1 Tax=Mesocestoides corti TaxID=53468 RepID=A0A5K3FNE5_MESCO
MYLFSSFKRNTNITIPASTTIFLDELAEKLRQQRQQLLSSSRPHKLEQEIDVAIQDLKRAAVNAFTRAIDDLDQIEKHESASLNKLASRIHRCCKELDWLEQYFYLSCGYGVCLLTLHSKCCINLDVIQYFHTTCFD